MKILLTNDDGVDAPGLAALRDAAATLGSASIVAPTQAVSGCAQSATTNRPLCIENRSDRTYAVDGTPTDCVRLALHNLKTRFDWVFSGINCGGNLGVDVYYSGTVAAVREAALYGVPGIAISQYHNRPLTAQDWLRAAEWASLVLKKLVAQPRKPRTFWNVNLPHLDHDAPDPVITFCPLDPSPLPLHFDINDQEYSYSGNYHQRSRQEGCDIRTCFDGHISVTQLSVLS